MEYVFLSFLCPSDKERTKESACAPIPASTPPPVAHAIPYLNYCQTLGSLMNENQALLEKLGVSTPKLDAMILAARNTGALGAKLSGAGGGDCMIALVAEEQRSEVETAIEKAGGEIIHAAVGVEGMHIEA